MKLDLKKVETAMARKCVNVADLKQVASMTTFQRIRAGHEVKPKTAGSIALALGVDVVELLSERQGIKPTGGAK